MFDGIPDENGAARAWVKPNTRSPTSTAVSNSKATQSPPTARRKAGAVGGPIRLKYPRSDSTPVRILQVIHQFPPHSSQGSEVYCHQLSKRLAATDEVRVFHISNTPRRRPRRLARESFDGLATYHCIDGAEFARLADWPNEFLRRAFQEVLTEYVPEIVHFHNYLSLGDDLVGLARTARARVVYTLHDFGLLCPNALLLTSDRRLCAKADPDFFQDCCPELIRVNGGRTPLLASRLPSIARWRLFSRQQAQPLVRTALSAAVDLATRWLGDPAVTDVAHKREFYLRATRKIFSDVDLFLSPSQFLRDRYVSCGIPEEKIVWARYGLAHFTRLPHRSPEGRLAFGYIGAFHRHKGVEVLIEAFKGLGDRADLHIFGSAFGSPISESYWRRISAERPAGVTFHGSYDNTRIGEILAGLDAVIVPSVWYENSPLTIQEAFIAGVPVVTSDRGGMAELVRDGIDGLHFRLGDSADLREKLLDLLENPAKLMGLRNGIPGVPRIEDEAAGLRERYSRLLTTEAASAPSAPVAGTR